MNDGLMLISSATQRNWEKLDEAGSDRLKRRANKTRSGKFIIPTNYISAGGMESYIL